MVFMDNIQALMGQYGDNLAKLAYDSTQRIFYLRKTQNNELRTIAPTNLKIGNFYLIKYNYNGNKIFCPIFTLEYKVIKNKNILYAVNLDYLPYKYKVSFFSTMLDFYKDTLDENMDIANVLDEHSLNNINFELIYKMLKGNGGYEYAVTAFDILKIEELSKVSTNILHHFLFLDTRMVNSANMKQLLTNSTDDELTEKIREIVKKYDSITLTYDNDTKYFYKRLRTFENNYKLTENIK